MIQTKKETNKQTNQLYQKFQDVDFPGANIDSTNDHDQKAHSTHTPTLEARLTRATKLHVKAKIKCLHFEMVPCEHENSF